MADSIPEITLSVVIEEVEETDLLERSDAIEGGG